MKMLLFILTYLLSSAATWADETSEKGCEYAIKNLSFGIFSVVGTSAKDESGIDGGPSAKLLCASGCLGLCSGNTIAVKIPEKASEFFKCRLESDQPSCTEVGGGTITEERFIDCAKIGDPYCIGNINRGKQDSEGRFRLKVSCLSGTESSCTQLDTYLRIDQEKETKEIETACSDPYAASCIEMIPSFLKLGKYDKVENMLTHHCETKPDHKACSAIGYSLLKAKNKNHDHGVFEKRCALTNLDTYCYAAWVVYITEPHSLEGEYQRLKKLCAKTTNESIACSACINRLDRNPSKAPKAEFDSLMNRLCSLNSTCAANCKNLSLQKASSKQPPTSKPKKKQRLKGD